MKMYLLATLCLSFLICCALSDKELVDLTWNFDNHTLHWTGVKQFVYTKRVENDERGYWYAASEFCCGEHGGTHLDAPYHFYKYGWKVGSIPLERLIAKGVLVDLSQENATEVDNGSINLEVKHLKEWEEENGPFETGSVLLVKFGRSQYWFNSTKYFEMNQQKKYNFPGVSKAAAEWLADSGKFFGVGLDTPSVDPGQSMDFMAHRVLNAKQMYVLENVKLTDDLPTKGFTLMVMPMKLKEGSGTPVRIVAILKYITNHSK